jgi:flagellar biosynthesis protein FliQ
VKWVWRGFTVIVAAAVVAVVIVKERKLIYLPSMVSAILIAMVGVWWVFHLTNGTANR